MTFQSIVVAAIPVAVNSAISDIENAGVPVILSDNVPVEDN